MSFATGVFPAICKLARIIPVFKDGNSSNCTNHRPIYLLMHECETLFFFWEIWIAI